MTKPKRQSSNATLIVFKNLLEQFAKGEATFGVVYDYMRRKRWLSKKAPSNVPLVIVKKEGGGAR